MVIRLNKGGMFFTFLAILIISILILSTNFFSVISERTRVQKRVETLNSFVSAVEDDLQRKIYITGFRSIFVFESYINEQGDYINDANIGLQELFFNGTLYGIEQNVTAGAKFSDIVVDLNSKASKVNAFVSLTNPRINVSQTDPWNLRFVLDAELSIADIGNLVSWNKSISIVSLVPIEEFADPIYAINTNGRILNNVSRTPYSVFVNGSNTVNLSDHLENSFYINSSSAPNFLNRLEGDYSASEYGVESLVNLDELAGQGFDIENKSVVDYIYFSTNNPAACDVQESGLPSWFKLDTPHLGVYQVSC